MYRKIALAWAFVVVCVLTLAPANSKAASEQRTLKVKLNYTGTERVDQRHKIYVLVFDANPFTSKSLIDVTGVAAPPAPEAGVCHILRRETASGKNQTLTFKGLGPSVYAMAFLDKTGAYDPHEDPPSGSPMGIYGKAAGNADPIALKEGKAVGITLTFDDSHKTP
jgi:hypothetical protein